MLKIAKILIVVILAGLSISAQEKVSPFDWDLSYKTLLERNKVAKSNWIWRWLEQYKSPAENWISGWQGKPIVSSIMIEYPAFHAAEHQSIWLIRTSDEAFYWESTEGHEADKDEEPVALPVYDAIYKQASSWQQLVPRAAIELPEQTLPGFMGFLNYNGPNGSKQMLLTMDDFVICLNKTCLPGPPNMKPGRLLEALDPILVPESRKTFRHKSEGELARMTPDQRIDEQIGEESHTIDHGCDQSYSYLIHLYRRMDGLRGVPYLIRLIDSYEPKKKRDTRWSSAVIMTGKIDDNVSRLRGSPEGKSAINAIERLSDRFHAAGKTDPIANIVLEWIKGVNAADRAIRDTLRVKYRIKISDGELAKFSNFLVNLDPTYPGWSERDFMKDHSRTNDAGYPAQVYIMKNPKRYHKAYLAFKKVQRES